MIKFLSYIAVVFIFIGCSTLKVSVDYDELYDFKKVKTFAIHNSDENSANTLFNKRVINALQNELELKNYKKVLREEADLIFVFYLNVKEKSDVQISYGFSGYRWFGHTGAMISTAHTHSYKEGTLVIDALSSKTQDMVWSGVGVQELRKRKTPKDRTDHVNKVVKKIMEKFPIH